MTIIDGVDSKDQDLGQLAKRMKVFCACGGTAKNEQIMLQGDQRDRARVFLVQQLGYPQENVEVQ
jgi:translation initiation factor 1